MADIKTSHTFSEVFRINVPVVEEDYPDQNREILTDAVTRGLVDFVRRVADKASISHEEERAVEIDVAMKLLEGMRSSIHADLLRRRLEERMHGAQETTNDGEYCVGDS